MRSASPVSLRPRYQWGSDGVRAPNDLSARGFTLIELMITVAILVILIGVGVPSFRGFMISQRVKNASFEVFAALVMARSEALTRNATVTVTPTGGNWANGWQITCVDLPGCVDPATGNPPLIIRQQDRYQDITINQPNGVAPIAYTGSGRVAATVNPISLTATGAASTMHFRCITIDISGRPVTKTGACP